MAKKPPVHVSPRDNGWAVVREGNDRATSVRRTQAAAAEEGRDIARRHETGFLLHGKDGRIREHNDYGSVQHPQEGASTGRAREAFAPGTRALGEPTADEEGRTVQRTTDERGGIVESVFDEEGDVVEEVPVGSATDLPGAEGHEETTDEEGITKRIVKDESGTLIELRIGPDGGVLELQIPPTTEKVEETTEQVGQAARGAQGGAEQATDQAQATAGQAASQAQDDAGGATRQARDTTGRATDGDQKGPAGRAAGQDAPEGQDAAARTTRQGDGGNQQDGERAEERGPNATPAAKRKAQELGAGLSWVEGTGSDGCITVDDVKKFAQTTEDGAGEGPEASDAAERRAEELGIDLSRVEGSGSGGRVTVRDVTGATEGTQEQVASGDRGQGEEQGTEEQVQEAEGGAGDATGQAAGQAVRGVQDTAEEMTEQAQELVGGLAGGGRQGEDGGRGRSQDTAEQASGRAGDASSDGASDGAAPQARDTAGSDSRRDDWEASRGGDRRQSAGGREPDATDAARQGAEEAGADLSRIGGSGARGRLTADNAEDPPGAAGGGTARERRATPRAERGARDAGGRTAEGAGAVAGPAPGGPDRPAGGSGGVAGGARDDEKAAEGYDDDRFEMVGERHADYDVRDSDGGIIGKVDHLFLDEDDRLEYVGVGLPGGGAVLIPAETVRDGDRRRMVVSRTRSEVRGGPAFADRGDVTPRFEERVRRHYGLPSRPGAEDGGDDASFAERMTEGEREPSAEPDFKIRVGDTEAGGFREHDRDDEGVRQSGGFDLEDELRVRRSEEEIRVGTREREVGSVNVRKRVRTDRERIEVPIRREEVTVERVSVEGETTAARVGEDEVAVPVIEEEAVVEKRPVAKEEVRVRKDVVEDTETVEEDVRREEIEVDDRTERRTG